MSHLPPARGAQDRKPQARDARLARRFVELADTLVDDYDVVDLLDQLARSCVDLLDVTAAGLLLIDQRGALQPVASSDEQTHVLELFQLQNREGPCLDCVRAGMPVVEPDLAAARGRWPKFTGAAAAAGYRSVLALPLRLRDQVIGGLNLFGTDPTPLTEDDQQIAQALADVATIGILQQRSLHRASLLAEQLQSALNTRIVIEQAKGVLAEHGQVDMATAFDALRAYARSSNQLLSSVATGVVGARIGASDVLAAHVRRR